MLKVKSIFVLISLINILYAQDNEIIMQINEKEITTSEFLKHYQKNNHIQGVEPIALDKFTDLFIDFKLKVEEAYAKGIHKNPKNLKDYYYYRNSAYNEYISEPQLTDSLVQISLERSKWEVDASHILVKINLNEKDTTKAYNDIVALRETALNKGFKQAMNSVEGNKNIAAEDLGIFTTLQMDYDFETSAFSTPVGSISEPVRSKFGYHIIKVHKKQAYSGSVQVAHILLHEGNKTAIQKKINNLYNEIVKGTRFDSLAAKYSQDYGTAQKGGVLPLISKGGTGSATLEEQAFSLDSTRPISKPFETKYGWHILKWIKNVKPTQEQLTNQIIENIKKDQRFALITKASLERIGKPYQISENKELLKKLEIKLPLTFYKNQDPLPKEMNGNKILLSIENQKDSLIHFVEFLKSQNKYIKSNSSKEEFIATQYQKYYEKRLLDFVKNDIENIEEYKYDLKEFKEGLLLFEIMNQELWSQKPDSTTLNGFYKKNKSKYNNSKNVAYHKVKIKVKDDYLKFKEKQWIKSLRKKYKVRIHKKVLKKLAKTIH